MKIAYMAAGAAGMYCGSCLRDNAVARELMALGEDVLLLPLYTPLRVERTDVQSQRVFYGGINIYLQQKFPWFRKPRLFDRLLDSRAVLKIANLMAGSTNAAELGDLTLSTLRGDEGNQLKELERLADWIGTEYQPDLINLPNSMFVGAARFLKDRVGVPLVCSLTGEDLFLDDLESSYRSRALELLRSHAGDVDRYIATSEYYADHMSELLNVDRPRIDVVPLGLDPENFPLLEEAKTVRSEGPFTLGYLARLAPEKGFHQLADAFIQLKRRPGMEEARLLVAGYCSPKDRAFFEQTLQSLKQAGVAKHVTVLGEVSFEQKIDFLHRIDVLSVPTVYREPKGLFVLEAMAAGVPVVQPAHGAFPELIDSTGGGVLYPPGDSEALVDALDRLARDREERIRLGSAGWRAVRQHRTARHMAERTREIYRQLVNQTGEAPRVSVAGRVTSDDS